MGAAQTKEQVMVASKAQKPSPSLVRPTTADPSAWTQWLKEQPARVDGMPKVRAGILGAVLAERRACAEVIQRYLGLADTTWLPEAARPSAKLALERALVWVVNRGPPYDHERLATRGYRSGPDDSLAELVRVAREVADMLDRMEHGGKVADELHAAVERVAGPGEKPHAAGGPAMVMDDKCPECCEYEPECTCEEEASAS
jgi:hypothetical protein